MSEEYEDKYVVFIDILGFKILIEGDDKREAKSASEIGEILEFFLPENIQKFIEHSLASSETAKDEFFHTNLRITNFSDSLVISFGDKETPSMNACMAYDVIEAIANISMILLREYQVHLRGGMAFGAIHHSDKMLYGPALDRAYEIESKLSEYPRILIERLELPNRNAYGYQNIHNLINYVDVKNSKYLEFNIANAISYMNNTHNSFNEHVKSFRKEHNLSNDNDLKGVINSCRSLLSEIESNPSFYENGSSLRVWQKHKWIVDKLDSMDL